MRLFVEGTISVIGKMWMISISIALANERNPSNYYYKLFIAKKEREQAAKRNCLVYRDLF